MYTAKVTKQFSSSRTLYSDRQWMVAVGKESVYFIFSASLRIGL